MGKIKPFDYKSIKEKPEAPKRVYLEGVQIIPLKGEPGETPNDARLISLIKPLIPPPIKPKDGEDYILTDEDKKEIANKVKVPVVEKVIEKKEVRVEIPIVKEIAKKDSPEEVRDKLEGLKKGSKLTIFAIEDLPDLLDDLSKFMKGEKSKIGLLKGSVHARKGQEIRFVDDETIGGVDSVGGVQDGVNLSFVLSKNPVEGSVKVYAGGSRLRVAEDYTISGKTITFIFAPQPNEILLVDYRY